MFYLLTYLLNPTTAVEHHQVKLKC